MYFDYISDLHIDKNGLDLIDSFIKKSNVLLIGGDIAEDFHTIEKCLLKLKNLGYEYICFTPGNHDLFMKELGDFKSHYNEMIKYFKKLEKKNIYLMHGQIVSIEGINISGLSLWYDGAYIRHAFNTEESFRDYIQRYYGEFMIDYYYISEDIFEVRDFFYEKSLKMSKNIDIMITHINPLYQEEFMSKRFPNSPSSIFYGFDSNYFRKDRKIKHWVFGHTHDEVEFFVDKTNFHCNPCGYRHENNKPKIKTFKY